MIPPGPNADRREDFEFESSSRPFMPSISATPFGGRAYDAGLCAMRVERTVAAVEHGGGLGFDAAESRFLAGYIRTEFANHSTKSSSARVESSSAGTETPTHFPESCALGAVAGTRNRKPRSTSGAEARGRASLTHHSAPGPRPCTGRFPGDEARRRCCDADG